MDTAKLQAELRKTRRQLMLLYEVGNLMRTTLKLDEIIFLVLSAVTSHEGLGFNRAILFLTDELRSELCGVFGIGPADPRDSIHIWKDIDERKLHLDGFIDVFRKSRGNIDPQLNKLVQQIKIPFREDHGGIIVRTALEGMPLAALTDATRSEIDDPILTQLQIDHFVAVPVKGKDQIIGTLIADNISTRKPIAREDILNLTMLADHAGLAIENATQFHAVLETSKKDSLTDLWNHAHFQELLSQSIQVAKLQRSSLSVLLFDVDDFKRYNDQYMHQAGDKALAKVAGVIGQHARRSADLAARYGGEEFALILTDTSVEAAMEIAKSLRKGVEDLKIVHQGSDCSDYLTVSVGVAMGEQPNTAPHDSSECKLLYTKKVSSEFLSIILYPPCCLVSDKHRIL